MNGMGVYMGEGKSEKCPNDGAAKSGCGKNHKIRNTWLDSDKSIHFQFKMNHQHVRYFP